MKKFKVILYTMYFFGKKIIQSMIGFRTFGVRAVIINNMNEILLVKHTYIPGWHFPGGGVDRGETPREAIRREIREEAGIIALGDFKIFDSYFHKLFGVDDIVNLYIVRNFEIVEFQSPEIIEARWYALSNLPKDISKATQRRIDEVFAGKQHLEEW